ncbi:hypothetical protein SPAR_31961 [Streptomyces sparsogenes DSM 40356]|uniref:Ku domain-containing protein n=1 Tax=Streptomyces sparsogenes DSM 40356 TaxID=1331668 RepID=A0A1R1SAX4_9ACTN|nr:hypothetical protein SPAR_31961 [Streptomyces sparsogenes DSM 40356]
MARAIWSGVLTFGLVTVPVQMFTATQDRTVHFHQLQRGTSARVRYQRVNERTQRVNERTGKEVDHDDIVKGYDLGERRLRQRTGGAKGQEDRGPETGGEGGGQDDLAQAGEHVGHGSRPGSGEARVAAAEQGGAVSAASDQGIPGRSKMSHDELADALTRAGRRRKKKAA